MKWKEWLIYQKIRHGWGQGYLSDGVTGGIIGYSLAKGEYNIVIALVFLRWFVGVIAERMGFVQTESELTLKKGNPYMDKKLSKQKR